jgi:hypothetical protein
MKNILLKELYALDLSCKELLNKYVDFCIEHDKGMHAPGVTEYHHILPKSIWKEFEDLSEHPWNGVHLTYKDHYIAHSMLASASEYEPIVYAWWRMNSGNKNYKKHDGIEQLGELYTELREKHRKIVSENQKSRNKSKKTIEKRKKTLSKVGEDGLTGWQRNGKKISKILKESGSCAGENNPQFQKMIVKNRVKPSKRQSIKPNDYDPSTCVPFQTKYIILYDNTGEVYFEGWKDEAESFCESIGLDPRKINYSNDIIFNYTGTQNNYLLKVMKLAGLGRYIDSKIVVLNDEEAEKHIMKCKEKCPL